MPGPMASKKDNSKTQVIISPSGDPIVIAVGSLRLVIISGNQSERGAALKKAWLEGVDAEFDMDRQQNSKTPSLSTVRKFKDKTGAFAKLVAKVPVIRVDPKTGESD